MSTNVEPSGWISPSPIGRDRHVVPFWLIRNAPLLTDSAPANFIECALESIWEAPNTAATLKTPRDHDSVGTRTDTETSPGGINKISDATSMRSIPS